jgi:hypothetical protein
MNLFYSCFKTTLTLLAMLVFSYGYSQTVEVRNAVYSDVSIPLRDMKPAKKPLWERWKTENESIRVVPNKFRDNQTPGQADQAVQSDYPATGKSMSVIPNVTFDGLDNADNSGRVTPPDPAGDVGPNHYVQAVNCMLQMFSKTGTSVYGPVTTSTIWNGFSGNWSGHNDGDAIILYDENADRWIISQFAIDCSQVGGVYTEYQLVAVSTTPDPTGSYYRYAFQFDYMPDYPKLGVWNDGYYMAINRFNTNTGGSWVGAAAVAMERSKMLTGDPAAKMVYFKTETLGGSGSASGLNCGSMLPSDCDGTMPAAGTPNYFMYDDQFSSEMRIWALHADWTTPANSTFTYLTALPVAAYTELSWSGIVPQLGTTLKLDGLGDRLMFRNQYRNFGSYETFVTSRSVSTGGAAGLRWYEFRKTGSTFSVYQQSTYAPADGKWRWMPSVAMNATGDIGIAYTISSGTMNPSIYFTGRKAADPLNQLTIPESIIHTGTVSMTGTYTRWGDYAAVNVDPSDNQTFWATHEYVGTFGGSYPWATKIASFKFASTPIVATLDATAITGVSATLNGTVNPNGFATNYHFEWGTTTGYGNNTATVSAGSGTSATAVNAPISGLTGGITYHFRIVAVNSEGTSNGNDFTFTPGAAALTTAAVTGLTTTGATSGGTITSDGGSAVTARGVCWSTSVNPTTANSKTVDGMGTGTYPSSITGLTANTTYHVRAYATNGNGTYYGNDITFTTLCGTLSLPFSETFAGATIPTCWSQADNQGNGQVWTFGTITGYTPAPVLTGNYAYLNSDLYGSGNAQNADLISPTIDMTGYTGITLSFSHFFRSYTGSSGSVSYSINNGATWTNLQTFTATSANPASFSQVIAALTGQAQVKFKWNYTGAYGYYWAVDNISVTGTAATPLTVTPANQNVTQPAGTTPFTVTTPAAWTAVSNQAWCTVTPSGTGNGTLTATYSLNASASSRSASITVSATGATPVVVTVTQAGTSPTLTVTPPNQNVTAPAGTTPFTVTSNSAWTAVSNAAWCTVTPSGSGNGTLTATFTQNTLITSRVANITVTVTGLSPVVVTVTQAGGTATLAVTPPNQNVSAAAGNTSFTVTSNATWTVSSNSGWCTVTPSGSGNGTLTATYTLNGTVNSRVAIITVTVTGLTPVTVTVTQSGASPTLSVTPPIQNVSYPAGNTSFTVTSNSAWTAVSDAAWCSVTPSGTGNGTISAAYQENTLLTARTANITVTVAGLTPVVVTVVQAAAPPTLIVTPIDQNVSAESGIAYYSVTCNTAWTATSNTFWCIVTPDGNGNGIIAATYEANTALTQRTSYLAVSATGVPNVNLTLTQAAAQPYLTADPHSQNVGMAAGTVNFTVNSNMAWVVSSDSPWCTVSGPGNGNGTVAATFADNNFASTRTANITISATGIYPASATVTVIQSGPAAALSVEPAVRNVTDPAGSTTFTVQANTSWSCTSDVSWCVPTVSGSGNGTITATYQQNLTPSIRTATLEVMGLGTFPASVKVIQLPSFVSIDEHKERTIEVYPNPTTGTFVISSATPGQVEMRVTILDPNGQLVLTRFCSGSENYSFDLSGHAAGNYFVKVETGGRIHVLKMIVQ